MEKFNPTITAYLVPYITEGHDNTNFCYWVSLLAKVEQTTGPSVYIAKFSSPRYDYPKNEWFAVWLWVLGLIVLAL